MKKVQYWLISVLMALVITNPTMQDFKDFKGTIWNNSDSFNLRKKTNYIIFSRYDFGHSKFIGIFKNFYLIGVYETIPELKYNNPVVDTTKVDSLSKDTIKK